MNSTQKDEESGRAIIDFKSRLRKVDNSTAPNGKHTTEEKRPEPNTERKHSESGSLDTSGGDDDDKRRSTGSIGSLKKLWENKDVDERLSPKLKPRGEDSAETSPDERGVGNVGTNVVRSGSLNCKREDKPAVPSKPAVKGKIGKGGIYATPLATITPAPPATEEDEDNDSFAELRASLEWCTNEVNL